MSCVKGPRSAAKLVEGQPVPTSVTGPRRGPMATLSIDAPPGSKLINANSRAHRMAVAKLTSLWRAAACDAVPNYWLTGWLADGGPVRIWCEVWKPVQNRYDPGNLYPTAKACVDGFRDAGLIVDDDWRHVEGPHMIHGGRGPTSLLFRFEQV